MGNALETASCCTDAENPGRAERTTEFPPQLKVQLSARRHADLPPGQVVNVSPRTAKKFTQSGFPIVESCSDTVDSQADTGESADNVNDLQAKPINPKIPLMAFRYDFPPGARRQHWKLSAMEETVGVGAHFEATQSGAIKVRGLSKGSPADQSGLFSIGDELIEVDGVKAFGRPLSELGQYVLGKPGSQVRMVLCSRAGDTYEVCIARGKGADAAPRPCIEPTVGEYNDTLRL